jgi:hypothetical protein
MIETPGFTGIRESSGAAFIVAPPGCRLASLCDHALQRGKVKKQRYLRSSRCAQRRSHAAHQPILSLIQLSHDGHQLAACIQ